MRKHGLLVTMTLLIAACSKAETPQVAELPSIEVRAANYVFDAPAAVSSGPIEIKLFNEGPEPHQAQLFKLNADVKAKQVVSAAGTDAGVEALGTFAGGPNAVDAGESQVATTEIPPGSYVLMCLVPDTKGRSHASLGMVKAITVEQNDEDVRAPTATYTATTKDFDFEFPDAWTGSITVNNIGEEEHEFQIMEIAKGKTEKDFLDSFKSGAAETDPPPWETGGGVAVIPPGSSNTFEANVAPGTYFLMCFVFSPTKMAPHFAIGMLKKFVVP